jgi:hypothetical protein
MATTKECYFAEHILLVAYSRGIYAKRRPSETILTFASRVMNVGTQHIRFTLSGQRLHAHYNYPDLLDRDAFEYAVELKSMGISESVLGSQVLPLNITALYNILLFCKQSNPVHARVLLQCQAGARVAASWSYIPTPLTLMLLKGQYTAAVQQTLGGTPASLSNPNSFSVADFACRQAVCCSELDAARAIIVTERLAPSSARTFRILLSKYNVHSDRGKLQGIVKCIVALRAKQLHVHTSDVQYVFNRIKQFAEAVPTSMDVRLLCRQVMPLLVKEYLQILFVPTSLTPWWFLQLFYTALVLRGVPFMRYMQSVQLLNTATASAIIMPFRPEYSARWPAPERETVTMTYKALLQVPLYTLWQAVQLKVQHPLAVWSCATHRKWPRTYQAAVSTVMHCSYGSGSAKVLPTEIVCYIFRFCFLHDFRP